MSRKSTGFAGFLREMALHHKRTEEREEFNNRTVIEDPVVFEMRPGQIIVADEFPTYAPPVNGEVVEVKLFGGRCLVLVNVSQFGQEIDNEHLLFIHGKLIKV